MYEQLLQAMFKLQEVRRIEDGIDEKDMIALREAVGLINGVILSQGETLDENQEEEVAVTSDGNEIMLSSSVTHAMSRNREVVLRSKMYEDELRDSLYENMDQFDIKKFENDVFTATRIDPSTSNRFATAEFKKEHPELYEEFVTQSERKGYVKINYKD